MHSAQIDPERLWQSLMTMARIGGLPGGGCCRLALTDEDKQARDQFCKWCEAEGCSVRVDKVGNIYARRNGADNSQPAIATGSHLDTQPHGGKFDGVYGVMAGLEVIRALNAAQIETVAPIEVIIWTNEEGARFSPPLTGSLAFAGRVSAEEVHHLKTRDGKLVRDELDRIGYLGEVEPGSDRIGLFVEAHIEQGPILESEKCEIGIVEGIQGICWLEVEIVGRDSHAGTVPMDSRKDALLGACQMIVAIPGIAEQLHKELRMTVGRLDVSPNSGSTIPGQVNFNVDIRHADSLVIDKAENRVRDFCHQIARVAGMTVQIEKKLEVRPVLFNSEAVSLVRSTTQQLGYTSRDIISGAGHDAMNIAQVVPTTMIFVPSKDGISHNEQEYSSAAELAAGATVLCHALLRKAGIA